MVDCRCPAWLMGTALVGLVVAGAASSALPAMQAQDPPPSRSIESAIERSRSKDPEVRFRAVVELQGFGAPAVPHLIRLLGDPDGSVSGSAGNSLGELGALAVPCLIDELGNRDEQVAYGVSSVLMHIGDPAVRGLIDALKKRTGAIRGRIAGQLGAYGGKAAAAVPLLVQLLSDPDGEVRDGATSGLAGIGPAAVLPLLEALKDLAASVRRGAASAFVAMNPFPREAVAPLAAAMKDEVVEVRRAASAALAAAKSLPAEVRPVVVQTLVASLKDPDSDVVETALKALGDDKDWVRNAIPVIASLLDDRRPRVREEAGYALANIGPAAAPAVPQLIASLTGTDFETLGARHAAVSALGSIGPEAKAAVPRLTELLADHDTWIREAAATALGEIGPEARDSIPALKKLTKDKEADVRAAAAEALGRIGGAGVEQVLPLLKDKKAAVREGAARALGEMGAGGKDGVPALILALADRNPEVRGAAIYALGSIGPDAAAAIPALWEIVKKAPDGEPAMRAAESVGRMGTGSLPFLLSMLRSGDVPTWSRVIDAFRSMGATAVPSLVPLLKDESVDVRRSAASMLAHLGESARTALGDLAAALDDKDGDVREAAAMAMAEVGADALVPLTAMLTGNGPVERKRLATWAISTISLSRIDVSAAVPAIRSLLESTDPGLRAAATRALNVIEGK